MENEEKPGVDEKRAELLSSTFTWAAAEATASVLLFMVRHLPDPSNPTESVA